METCTCQYLTQDKIEKFDTGETIYLPLTKQQCIKKENNAHNALEF